MSSVKYQLIDKYDRFDEEELFEQFRFIRALTLFYLLCLLTLFTSLTVFVLFVLPGLLQTGPFINHAIRALFLFYSGTTLYSLFKKNLYSSGEFLELTRNVDSEIFTLIDEVWEKANMKGSYKLYVTPKVNAFAGMNYIIFRKPTPTISIGILLLKYLTRKEFQCIIAHEIGHIKGKHSLKAKRADRIIRLIKSLLSTAEFPGLKHLQNELEALTFAIYRRFELEADELEYELCDATDIRDSFNKICALKGCEDRTFDNVYRLFFDEDKHSKSVQLILDQISAFYESDERPLLAKINYYKSDFYNIYHPSYKIRLNRIEKDSDFSSYEISTPGLLSKEKYISYCGRMSKRFIKGWKKWVKHGKKLRSEFIKLNSKKELTREEMWQLYKTAVDLYDDSAELILRKYKSLYDDTKGTFDLAHFEFRKGDFETCIKLLEDSETLKYKSPPELYLLQLAYRCTGHIKMARMMEAVCRDCEEKTGISPCLYSSAS